MVSSNLFFIQAEDGIRALVRSRGLGDVYKRQDPGAVGLQRLLQRHHVLVRQHPVREECRQASGHDVQALREEGAKTPDPGEPEGAREGLQLRRAEEGRKGREAVSYTHLTLPTIYTV